jgi:hypothetical protein
MRGDKHIFRKNGSENFDGEADCCDPAESSSEIGYSANHEASHRAAWIEWIATSLSLLAMTARPVIEPEIITLQRAIAG